MVRKEQFRMTVSTGNKVEYDLFQGIIKDVAVLDGVTPSAVVIGRCISPSLPPVQYKESDLWAQRLYCGTWGIKDALAQIFAENSAGVQFRAVHDNFDELVRFAHGIALDWELRTNTALPEMHHFIGCFESVVRKATNDGGNNKLFDPDYGTSLLNSYSRENNGQLISHALLFVLDNWESLGDYTYTFRMLGDLFRISTGWRDCRVVRDVNEMLHTREAAAKRKELVAVLTDIEKGWQQQ